MKTPVEAFDPPWSDVQHRALATRSRKRRLGLLAVVVVLGAAAFWLLCWRGRMATCDFWCSLGSASARNVLGRNHDEGDGTTIRDDLAVTYYRLACDGGHITACLNLGIMYENAEGVPPDPMSAAVLYRRACPERMSACRRLASLMVDSLVAGDAVVARTLERACDGHDEDAMKSCNALARMYDNGAGVPRDDKHAAKLYRRACEGHLDVACFNLSVMYRRGEGVDKSEEEADVLHKRSCRSSRAARCR